MLSSTISLILTAIAFGAVGVLSPTRAALTALMLTSETAAWPRAIGFLVGSTAVFSAAALLGLMGVLAAGGQTASPAINIGLGLAMVTAAGVMLVMRRRRKDRPAVPSRHPSLAAAGLGAGVAIQSFGRLLLLVTGGYRIGAQADLLPQGVIAIAAMLVIWQIPVWGLMALYVFWRERFDALAVRARPALDRIEDGALGAFIIAAFGIYLIFIGVTA